VRAIFCPLVSASSGVREPVGNVSLLCQQKKARLAVLYIPTHMYKCSFFLVLLFIILMYKSSGPVVCLCRISCAVPSYQR
jgi:hypothetical protein